MYISGIERNQLIMFPESIDEYIDDENPVRVVEAYVERLNIEEIGFTRTMPSDVGRPPYAPKDILKLYIYGYMNRIRSSRRLEQETKRNIEVMWLLKKLSPDHKTISRFRRENAEALKSVFRDFVKLCIKLGLYGRELAAIDGSKFKAVNSPERNLSVTELNERIKRLSARIDEYITQLNETDKSEASLEDSAVCDIKQIVEKLTNRRDTYKSYLEELSENGETQKSLTDGEARLMKGAKGFDVSYNVQTSVDAKYKLIAEFNVTNEGNDIKQLAEMAILTSKVLEAPNLTAVADTGYNSPSEIARCLEAGIMPQVAGSEGSVCIPCEESAAQEISAHKNGKCVYIKERNIVICPMGKVLPPKFYKNVDRTARYYNYSACSNCACRCTKTKYQAFGVRMKKDAFSTKYNADDLYVRQVDIKPDNEIICRRKELVEHPFGTIKRSMDAGYLLTKGIKNAVGEFSLAFLSYNLKRVINIVGTKKLIEKMRLINSPSFSCG